MGLTKAWEWANTRKAYWRIAKSPICIESLVPILVKTRVKESIQMISNNALDLDETAVYRTVTYGGVRRSGESPPPARFERGIHVKNNKYIQLLEIFWTFLKISPVSFGGGFAMMPMMRREIVEKRKWINEEEIIDAFALAQSTPGSVGVNSAAFIGFRIARFKGALAATIGMMIPTFFIVIILSILFLTVKNNPIIEAAFMGIRPAVVALISYAAIITVKSSIVDKSTIVLLISAVVLLAIFRIHPVPVIISGLFAGIAISKVKNKRKKNESKNEINYDKKVNYR